MSPQVVRTFVGFSTEITNEGSLSSVIVLMEFQQGKRGGPMLTLITFEAPLIETLVGFHVGF